MEVPINPPNPPPYPTQQQVVGVEPGSVDYRQLFHALLERAWIVVTVFVIAVLLTVAYLHRAPRIYSATATIQVEQQEQKILKFEKVVQEDLRSSETMRTIVQTLKGRLLLERIALSNNFTADPRFADADGRQPGISDVVAKIDKFISIRLRPGTRLIDITCENTDPRLTATLANALVQDYIRFGFEQDATASSLATESLRREAETLKRKLHDSEAALQRYMEETRSISLEEKQNIVTPKLKELNTRVTEAKSVRIKLESDYARVREVESNVTALLSIGSISTDPTIVGIQLNISKLESDFATLKQRYRQEHPKYIQMASQLTELRSSLTDSVMRAQQTLQAGLDSSREAERALEVALQEQEKAALILTKQAIQYSVLSREVESDRAMYDAVLSRLKETSLSKELATYKIRVIEPAMQPSLPVKPEKMKVLIAGLVLGLLAGIGLALGINSLDNTFKSVDQAEELLGLPVLATVPKISDLDTAETRVIVADNANSPDAEAFRNMRAALSMLGRVEDRRVFLFTSAVPQEGKTFCSVNFSISLAQQGLRTLLIDCDLRRPNVEKSLFGMRQSTHGVSDYLTGAKGLDDIVNSCEYANFQFIGVGTPAPNPAELLAQGRFANLIEDASKKFDRIVIDSAPIQAVSDTLLVLKGVQTICMAVRAGRTPRKVALRALQTLRQAGAPVAGVVLNCLRRNRGGGYYYNYYDYSSYGETPKPAKSKSGAGAPPPAPPAPRPAKA